MPPIFFVFLFKQFKLQYFICFQNFHPRRYAFCYWSPLNFYGVFVLIPYMALRRCSHFIHLIPHRHLFPSNSVQLFIFSKTVEFSKTDQFYTVSSFIHFPISPHSNEPCNFGISFFCRADFFVTYFFEIYDAPLLSSSPRDLFEITVFFKTLRFP